MRFRHLILLLSFRLLPCTLLGTASGPEIPVLRLETAIANALEHNFGFIISGLELADAKDAILAEEARFDVEWFGSLSLNERQSPASSSLLDQSSVPQTETRRARVGVQKRLATGANITLDSEITRRASNNNAPRNPDYSTDVGISIRQPLIKGAWGRLNLAPLARTRVSAERSLFRWRSDLLDLILETERAYWNLAYRQANHALTASSLELAENLLEENLERERLGLVAPLEVLQAESEVLNQQEAIIRADQATKDAEDALYRVMGNMEFPDLENVQFAVSSLPDTIESLRSIDQVVQATLRNDMEAKAQERLIEVERIHQMLARDETRPELDLRAGLTYLGSDTDGPDAYRQAYEAQGYNWNLGLEFRFPWSFRQARVRLQQATRDVERAESVLKEIKQSKVFAARNAWRAVSTGLKRMEVSRKARELNLQAFEQARARYGSGLVPYRNVLEAKRDYDRAQSKYLTALIETIQARVRLSRVDGTLLERNGMAWNLVESSVLSR